MIAIDLPGFGASPGDRNDMSPKALGAHLAAFFDELDLRDIHLVGPDVAMAAALSYAVDHDGQKRLASMTVGHGPGAPGAFKLGFMISMMAKTGLMRTSTAMLGAGPLIAFASKLGKIRSRSNPAQVDDYLRSYEGRSGEVVHWFNNLRGKAGELAKHVHTITVPTLVFWGDLDALFDVSNAELLHEALPNSELQILPEAGHFSWADQPELFASMIVDWATTGHRSVL